MSASSHINTLMDFFGNPNIIEIPGPIAIVITIHLNHPDGDILVFMTEICTRIEFELGRYKETSNFLILPLYSALPAESHSRIIEKISAPASCDKIARKIIVSTNLAETSLTIDGVAYVVDTGFCKQKIFNPELGSEVLASVPISKSAAIQRNIKRNVAEFDFIHTPPPYSLMLALQELTLIKAKDTQGIITETEKKLSTFPLEPQLSAILLKSCSLNCQKEINKIIAMLCTDVMCFVTPFDSKKEAEACRSTYMSPDGDHLTLLNVFDDFIANAMDQ
uniref:Helicase C-terminal domain-containing protein n=1 Tax=Tetranychus urticae TaxID=32264 RepID=T1JS67_TETUR